jgi:SAM-dependent methyltransferase
MSLSETPGPQNPGPASPGFDALVPTMAEKWREVPGGNEQHPRRFSDTFAQVTDATFLAEWERQYQAAVDMRAWYWRFYGQTFKGARILELGSGLGFDAVHFTSLGARVTCCDIAPSNLDAIRRVATARRLGIDTFQIESVKSFERLASDYDLVWCNGSIHHMPFAAAREECLAVLPHVKTGGRWIELAYPRERWVREGSLPFDKWGQLTDGERTPWVEWYDMEKLKQRLFPWRLKAALEHRHHSDQYIWLDVILDGRQADDSVSPPRSVPVPRRRFRTPRDFGSSGPSFALGLPRLEASAAETTVEIDCTVDQGSVAFWLQCEGRPLCRESIADLGLGSRLLYLSTPEFSAGVKIATRNAAAHGSSRFALKSVTVRSAL